MKVKLLLLIAAFSLNFGCTSEPTYTVSFCDQEEMSACPAEARQFTLGKRVYVKLDAEDDFGSIRKLTGTVFKLREGAEKYKMGSKDFEISPEQEFILQDIPFDEFGMQALGTFEIEFADENGQLIAVERLEIVQP